MDESLLVGVVLIVVLWFIYYVKKCQSFWADHGVDGPPPMFFFGNIFDLFSSDVHAKEVEYTRKYGRVYGIYHFWKPSLKVAKTEAVKKIMVKDFVSFNQRLMDGFDMDPITRKQLFAINGHEWKRQRTIMTPTFTSAKMKQMYPLMESCFTSIGKTIAHLLPNNHSSNDHGHQDRDTAEIDCVSFFQKLTMDIIAMCCFTIETRCHDESSKSGQEFHKNARSLFVFPVINIIKSMVYPMWFKEWIKFSTCDPSAKEFFVNVTLELMHQRREMAKKGKKNHVDFLQIMMDAAEDSGSINQQQSEAEHDTTDQAALSHLNIGQDEDVSETGTGTRFKSINQYKKLDETDIIANAITFFGVGYETTAPTLKYAAYALALYQDIQEKLFQEIKTGMELNGGILDYELVTTLKYLDNFVSETLRVFGGLRVPRQACVDYKLELEGKDKPIPIPKGTTVDFLFRAMSNDPEYWENPEIFNPERWSGKNKQKIVPYSYLPFGAGPRNCIGMRFALLEIKLTIAKLLLEYNIVRTDKTDVPLKFEENIFIKTCDRVFVGLKKRG